MFYPNQYQGYGRFGRAAGAVGVGAAVLRNADKIYKYGKRAYTAYRNRPSGKKTSFDKVENVHSALSVSSKGRSQPVKRRRVVHKRKIVMPARKVVKRLKHLEKKVENNTGHLVYKYRQTEEILSTVNHCNYFSISGLSTAILQTGMAQLRYYNPGVPGTYDTADFSTGTQTKRILYSCHSRLIARNNYSVPCEVDVYLCTPRSDQSDTTVVSYTNGLADCSGLGVTDVMVYPSEVPLFRNDWKIRAHKKAIIAPGTQIEISSGGMFKSLEFDPSYYDETTLNYNPKNGSHQYLIRVSGVVCHDKTTTTNNGICAAGVDLEVDTRIDYKYPAGANLFWIATLDNSDAMAAGGNVSMPTITQMQYAA